MLPYSQPASQRGQSRKEREVCQDVKRIAAKGAESWEWGAEEGSSFILSRIPISLPQRGRGKGWGRVPLPQRGIGGGGTSATPLRLRQ